MSWRAVDELSVADAGFEAEAADLPGLLASAVDAVLSLMAGDPGRIEARERRPLRIEADDAAGVLRGLLEEIIYRKDAEGLLLRLAGAVVRERRGRLALEADLRGERLDPSRHEPGIDVKAVTWQGFTVTEEAGRWRARFVLDV